MDLAPLQGKWDYKGSRIWINDREIMPPVWTATHQVKSNEIPLGNENCVARSPLAVHLNKGWNKVFLKLPVGKFRMDQARLVKWMFTAVFVTPDGERAAEGLIYSPDKQNKMKRIVLLLLGLLLALPQFAQERKYSTFMSRERLCLKNFRLLQKILFF